MEVRREDRTGQRAGLDRQDRKKGPGAAPRAAGKKNRALEVYGAQVLPQEASELDWGAALLAPRTEAEVPGVELEFPGVTNGGASDGGAPLPGELRARLEAAAGESLEDVRVHTGPESAAAARELGARAFATGRDIHFGEGQYEPGSADGRFLIAHEVAHTVQQPEVGDAPLGKLEVAEEGDAREVEADQFAEAFVADWAGPRPLPLSRGAAAPAIRRAPTGHGRSAASTPAAGCPERLAEPDKAADQARRLLERLRTVDIPAYRAAVDAFDGNKSEHHFDLIRAVVRHAKERVAAAKQLLADTPPRAENERVAHQRILRAAVAQEQGLEQFGLHLAPSLGPGYFRGQWIEGAVAEGIPDAAAALAQAAGVPMLLRSLHRIRDLLGADPAVASGDTKDRAVRELDRFATTPVRLRFMHHVLDLMGVGRALDGTRGASGKRVGQARAEAFDLGPVPTTVAGVFRRLDTARDAFLTEDYEYCEHVLRQIRQALVAMIGEQNTTGGFTSGHFVRLARYSPQTIDHLLRRVRMRAGGADRLALWNYDIAPLLQARDALEVLAGEQEYRQSELSGMDRADVTSAKLHAGFIAGSMGAATLAGAAPAAAPLAGRGLAAAGQLGGRAMASLGTEAGLAGAAARNAGSALTTWALVNPQKAADLAEVLVALGMQYLDGGSEAVAPTPPSDITSGGEWLGFGQDLVGIIADLAPFVPDFAGRQRGTKNKPTHEAIAELADAAARKRQARSDETVAGFEAERAAGRTPVVDSPMIGGNAGVAGLRDDQLQVDKMERWHKDPNPEIAQTAKQLKGVKKAGLGDPLDYGDADERVRVDTIRAMIDVKAARGPVINGTGTLHIAPGGKWKMTADTDKGQLEVDVTGIPVISSGMSKREGIPGGKGGEAAWNEAREAAPGRVVFGDEANHRSFDPKAADDWVIVGTGGTSVSAAENILRRNPQSKVTIVGMELDSNLEQGVQFQQMQKEFGDRMVVRTGVRAEGVSTERGPDGTHVTVMTDKGPITGEGLVASLGRGPEVPSPIAQAVVDAKAREEIVRGEALFDRKGRYLGYRVRFEDGQRVDVVGAASRSLPTGPITFDRDDVARVARANQKDAPPGSGNFPPGFGPSAEQAARYKKWRQQEGRSR